jgi:ATP-binding cassette, subfamily B, multidrug efflux pump
VPRSDVAGIASALSWKTKLLEIRQAGRIVVLEHGAIVEQGTHDELLAAKERYYEHYRDWDARAAA